MSRSSFDRAGLALMVSTILVWAGSWIAMKLIVPYIGPFDFVALRYVTGSVVLFALAAATGRPLGLPSWKLTLLIGLTQTAGFQGFVQTALAADGILMRAVYGGPTRLVTHLDVSAADVRRVVEAVARHLA